MWNYHGTASLCCLFVIGFLPWNAVGQEVRPEKWEYGELRHHERSVDRVGPDSKKKIEFLSADGLVSDFGWEAMADKLKVPALKKDALKDVKKYDVDPILRLRVLNHLGGQGWEMISFQTSQNNGHSLWIFKRRLANGK